MADPTNRPARFARIRGIQAQEITFMDDHILTASGSYKQQYRRMFYRDIEAFSVADSFAFAGWIILFVLGIAFFAWLGWLAHNAPGPLALFFFIPMGVLFLFLIFHIVRGPTVHCALRSGVQTLRLPALGRRKKADRFLEQLVEKTREVQSPFDQELFRRFIRLNKNTPPPIPIAARPGPGDAPGNAGIDPTR